jgi:Protein of unknown function (DUF4058)
MPLRDHFHPPVFPRHSWDKLHAMWPAMMVLHLAPKLPPGFEVAPGVHIGDRSGYELDIATFERDEPGESAATGGGGAATLTWAPTKPTVSHDTDIPDQDAYEVRVYDAESGQRLVAAVEIVSPRNKDRPASRQAFVNKVADLLRQDVCVSVVDLVTEHHFNLYAELMEWVGHPDPLLNGDPPAIYAVTMRRRERGQRRPVLDTWFYPLAVGQPLPTLELWLSDTSGVTLDLEATYEDTCRPLNIR